MSKEKEVIIKNDDAFINELYKVECETMAIESICYLIASLDSCNIDTDRVDTVALLETCANMSAHVNRFLSDNQIIKRDMVVNA